MNNRVLASNQVPANALTPRSIGAILVDTGRLSADGAERIMRLQRERGMRFGDAAIELGLLTREDIEFALSSQFDYPYLLKGQSRVSEEIIAAYSPFSMQVEALRALRSQLLLRWFDVDFKHKSVALVSPDGGEGRSFLAANLAVVFSQLGARTLLIDADLRRPRQHAMFGLDNRMGLAAVVTGRIDRSEAVQRVPALVDLSVLCAGVTPPNPLELLGRPAFSHMLREMARDYDVILIDTPAAATCADAQTVAVRAGAALMVTRKNVSHIGASRRLVEGLAQSSVAVVGSVLNEF